MPAPIPGAPLALLQSQLDKYASEIDRARRDAEYSREDALRFDKEAERLTAERAEYEAAIKRLTSGKADVGTFTATLKLDTTVFDKQVAAAEAAIAGLNGIA